jgi:uncharacterized LabA/DUF88 family protein
MSSTLTRTSVYIDGFNLYYGCLKHSPWKWLDIAAYCRHVLPQNDIRQITYCTAKVKPRHDPGPANRQQVYLRALGTLPVVAIVFGHFLERPKTLPLARSVPGHSGFAGGPVQFVEVMNAEEKGSDVNLATHLLVDGFQDTYDLAVVVSNDSDLVYPVEVVRKVLKKRIGVIIPILDPDTRRLPAGYRPRVSSRELSIAASFVWRVKPADLAAAQFPPEILDSGGRAFRRPPEW